MFDKSLAKDLNILVFDTETTGLHPGNICQLSYIMLRDSQMSAKNFYFKVDYVEPRAQMVHKLSTSSLKELSLDRSFSDFYEEIYKDFFHAERLVAHNYSFDKRFIDAEFTRAGGTLRYKKHFCTMKNFTDICQLKSRKQGYKYPKLGELVQFMNVSYEDIKELIDYTFIDEGIGYHDARYDTAATFLSLMKALECNLIDKSRLL